MMTIIVLNTFGILWQDIINNPSASLLLIANLVIIESLLSIDNAAVLATMVMNLPEKERSRALRIGIIFAYIFRGVALLLAGYLLSIDWVKLVGGSYLLFLGVKFFYEKWKTHKTIAENVNEEIKDIKPGKRLFGLSLFWSTVVMVEAMDLVFSLDNVLAAGALSNNIIIVCIGVFIGIITMRIVAQYFVKLLALFPFLDTSAFIVILLLGTKLVYSYFVPHKHTLADENFWNKYGFSVITITVFLLPLASSYFFNFPQMNKEKKDNP